MSACIGGEHITHLVQSNKLMYKEMKLFLKNWVQLSCDFGKVVPNSTTQGKVCHRIMQPNKDKIAIIKISKQNVHSWRLHVFRPTLRMLDWVLYINIDNNNEQQSSKIIRSSIAWWLEGCNHNNTYHSQCNVCLVFSCFKIVI
jgi:hypothetical protein